MTFRSLESQLVGLRRLGAGIVLAATLTLVACASGPTREQQRQEDAARYNLRLGIAYMQQGNLQFAKDKLERALSQSPRNPQVHSALALLYDRLGEPDKVNNHYRTALRLAPGDPEITNNYAVFLCRRGRVDEGVERFYTVARNPLYQTPAVAYTNAGVCLRGAKRYEEAEQSFRRALEIRPNYSEAVLQLGELFLERGNAAEARAHLERFLSAFKPTADLLLLGVRVSNALGDRVGAERYARQLRADFPGSEQARALPDLFKNPG